MGKLVYQCPSHGWKFSELFLNTRFWVWGGRVCNCSMLCCSLLYVHSSCAIILMGKRELDALLSFSSWCLVMVVWLLLAVPWVCLRFVIMVFPDHTHLLFLKCWITLESSNLAIRPRQTGQSQIRRSSLISVFPVCYSDKKFVDSSPDNHYFIWDEK